MKGVGVCPVNYVEEMKIIGASVYVYASSLSIL